MTYQPKCQLSQAAAHLATDEMCDAAGRTVEQVMAELNQQMAVPTEIEKLPPPHDEMTQYRRKCAEWLAHRAICEAQAVKDMQTALKKATMQ